MKASRKNILIATAIVAAILLLFWTTSSWRADRGLSFNFGNAHGPEAELRQLDKKLGPVAERREKLRTQLLNSQKKERELQSELSSKLAGFDDAKRAELRKEFETGKISDENMRSPEIMVLHAKYLAAVEQRGLTSTLREQLAKYEYELTRALEQRDRLKERIENIAALGYDPQESSPLDKEKSFEALDALIAQTDSLKPEPKNAELTVDDVVNDGANADAKDVAESIFAKPEKPEKPDKDGDAKPDSKEKKTAEVDDKALDEDLANFRGETNELPAGFKDDLNKALGELNKLEGLEELNKLEGVEIHIGSKELTDRLTRLSKDGAIKFHSSFETPEPGALRSAFDSVRGMTATNKGMFLLFVLFCVSAAFFVATLIGIFLVFRFTRPQPQPANAQGGSIPAPTDPANGMTHDRVLLIVVSTLTFFFLFACSGVGAVIGFVIGYFISSWRSFIRLLAALFGLGVLAITLLFLIVFVLGFIAFG